MKKYLVLMILFGLRSLVFGVVVASIGDSEAEVRQKNPNVLGSAKMNGKKVLIYSDAKIVLQGGIVVSFSGDVGSEELRKIRDKQQAIEAKKRQEFEQKQRDLGLILYQGSWMKPEEKRMAELFDKRKMLLMRKRLVIGNAKKDQNMVSIGVRDPRIREIVLAKNNSRVEEELMKIDLMLIYVNAEIKKLSKGKK